MYELQVKLHGFKGVSKTLYRSKTKAEAKAADINITEDTTNDIRVTAKVIKLF